MKRVGLDDQMRSIQTIVQVRVLSGDGWDDQMKGLKN